MENYTLRLSNHLTGNTSSKRIVIECSDYLTFESVGIYKESDEKVKHAEQIVETLNNPQTTDFKRWENGKISITENVYWLSQCQFGDAEKMKSKLNMIDTAEVILNHAKLFFEIHENTVWDGDYYDTLEAYYFKNVRVLIFEEKPQQIKKIAMYEPPIKVDYYCERTTGMETKTLEVKTEFEDFCKEEIKDARSIAYAMNLTVTEQQTHMSLFLQFEGHETLKSKLFLLRP